MAKTRGFLARLFTKMGGSMFGVLSRFEEALILPRTARWLKLSLLGFFVALVGALSLKAEEGVIMCYEPALPSAVEISNICINPNPTRGADSVKVTATAKIPEYDIGTSYIMDASIKLTNDTINYPMKASDGRFSDTLEVIEGSLYVGGIEPETTWVNIKVTTSQGRFERESVRLVISEPEPDSTDNKEE